MCVCRSTFMRAFSRREEELPRRQGENAEQKTTELVKGIASNYGTSGREGGGSNPRASSCLSNGARPAILTRLPQSRLHVFTVRKEQAHDVPSRSRPRRPAGARPCPRPGRRAITVGKDP